MACSGTQKIKCDFSFAPFLITIVIKNDVISYNVVAHLFVSLHRFRACCSRSEDLTAELVFIQTGVVKDRR